MLLLITTAIIIIHNSEDEDFNYCFNRSLVWFDNNNALKLLSTTTEKWHKPEIKYNNKAGCTIFQYTRFTKHFTAHIRETENTFLEPKCFTNVCLSEMLSSSVFLRSHVFCFCCFPSCRCVFYCVYVYSDLLLCFPKCVSYIVVSYFFGFLSNIVVFNTFRPPCTSNNCPM